VPFVATFKMWKNYPQNKNHRL